VLFADLKGSTELIEGLDPEEARTLLDPALQAMMEAVHRYEGTVNQVLGGRHHGPVRPEEKRVLQMAAVIGTEVPLPLLQAIAELPGEMSSILRKHLVKGWRLKGEIALARRQWDEPEAALQQALAVPRTSASRPSSGRPSSP
jgi:class 3 adenylate cyclase